MRSNTARAAAGLVVVALAIVLFIVFQGGDDDESDTSATQTTGQQADGGPTGSGGPTGEPPGPPPAPPVPTIRIQGDALADDVEQIDVNTGETVRFRVVADQAWDLHVHGFDVEDQVQPGKPLEISFPAEIEGTFEAEVHGETAEFPIAEINVSPS